VIYFTIHKFPLDKQEETRIIDGMGNTIFFGAVKIVEGEMTFKQLYRKCKRSKYVSSVRNFNNEWVVLGEEGLFDTFDYYNLPRLLKSFKNRYPDITFAFSFFVEGEPYGSWNTVVFKGNTNLKIKVDYPFEHKHIP
jgi:hypothetical protein